MTVRNSDVEGATGNATAGVFVPVTGAVTV
jgi:hypothetical protein